MIFILSFLLFNITLSSEVFLNKIKGDVKVFDEKNQEIKSKEGIILGKNYTVLVGKNSEAEVLLGEGIVVLYENTKYILRQNEKKEESLSFFDMLFGVKKLYAEEESWWDYLYGKATYFFKKLSSEYKIRTPHAVFGVRGTSFSVEGSDELTEIALFKGLVDIKKGEEIIPLKPGQSAYITRTDIKIQERISKIMEKERKRAEKLEKYFENVRKKLEERDKKIKEKLRK